MKMYRSHTPSISLTCFRFTQEDDSDPNEVYPWFISNISKQEAVDLLAKRELIYFYLF